MAACPALSGGPQSEQVRLSETVLQRRARVSSLIDDNHRALGGDVEGDIGGEQNALGGRNGVVLFPQMGARGRQIGQILISLSVSGSTLARRSSGSSSNKLETRVVDVAKRCTGEWEA